MAGIGQLIVQDAFYKGDPVLGGGVTPFVKIDTTPIERVQQYRYLTDKIKFDDKNEKDAAVAKEIASLSAFDPTSELKPYSEYLRGQLFQIQKYVKDDPSVLNYSRNPEGFIRFKEMQNKFMQARQAATKNDVLYKKDKAEIDAIADPNKRSIKQKELDIRVSELFQEGVEPAFNKTLGAGSDFSQADYQMPEIKPTEYELIGADANNNFNVKYKFLNPEQLYSMAHMQAAKMGEGKLDENSDWFKSLSPSRQDLEREKAKYGNGAYIQQIGLTNDINSLMRKMKEENPGVNFSQITENTDGSSAMGIIVAANKFNEQVDQLNDMILNNKLKDKTGVLIKKPFSKIKIDDGINLEELNTLNYMMKKGAGLLQEVSKDQKYTGIGLNYDQLAETKRNNTLDFIASTRGGASGAGGNAESSNTQTSGNAFDEIGGDEEIVIGSGGWVGGAGGIKISDGVVYDDKGNLKTGQVSIPANKIPASAVGALKVAGIELKPVGDVKLIVKDGQIQSITPSGGNVISRQGMENAQKKFDTEQKGQQRTQWGRRIGVSPIQSQQPASVNTGGSSWKNRATKVN